MARLPPPANKTAPVKVPNNKRRTIQTDVTLTNNIERIFSALEDHNRDDDEGEDGFDYDYSDMPPLENINAEDVEDVVVVEDE